MWKQVLIDYQATYYDSIFVKDTLEGGGYLGCNELGCGVRVQEFGVQSMLCTPNFINMANIY
jgi:hypothetical protein